MKKLYAWDVDPDWLVYTSGVNNGCSIAARVLCNAQRGYLIQTPVYNHFHEIEELLGYPKITVPLAARARGNKIEYQADLDAFRKKAKRAGMFLLCHPHNPVGHVFSRRELLEMAKICIENGAGIVSDEIHGELVLGNAKFTPLASHSPDIAKHTITLISASKAFNVPGLSCAFAIIPDANMREKFYKTAYGMYYEVSIMGLTAARVAYSGQADSWLNQLRRHLTANRDFLVDFVTRHMPKVRTTVPDATSLAWLDFTQADIPGSPFEFFMERAKVALSDGKIFGKEGEGCLRINFGTSRAVLKEGLDRMRRAMNSL
jgi:cystathionine beta-lyase